MTPVKILFELAGKPPQSGCAELPTDAGCRIHGGPCEGRGVLYDRWQGSTFTDQNKLRDWSAEHVCEACVWAHAWNVPPGFPPPEPGKKGVNLRLYSHFWCDGEYHAWNKANKAEIRDWLRASKPGPWFAAIADTGQKHVLPWTPMNYGGAGAGVVRFEEQNVRLGSFALIDDMIGLLTAGATKEEIASGDYTPRAWQLARKEIESFERDHGGRLRGGGWFALALWLSQRDEEKVQERLAAEKAAKAEKKAKGPKEKEAKCADSRPARKPKRPDRAAAAVDESRAPADGERESTHTLGSDPQRDAGCGKVVRDVRGVGDDGGKGAPARRPVQQSLFED